MQIALASSSLPGVTCEVPWADVQDDARAWQESFGRIGSPKCAMHRPRVGVATSLTTHRELCAAVVDGGLSSHLILVVVSQLLRPRVACFLSYPLCKQQCWFWGCAVRPERLLCLGSRKALGARSLTVVLTIALSFALLFVGSQWL